MGLILLFVRIARSSFDVKYKALGFDIFQKSNENGSLTISSLYSLPVFFKEDISKKYEAFRSVPWTCKIRQIFRSR